MIEPSEIEDVTDRTTSRDEPGFAAPTESMDPEIDTVNAKEIISNMFAERVSNPAAWYRNSRALFAAARASRERCSHPIDHEDRVDIELVISMLYGFGLECLFKALIVLADFGNPYAEGWVPKAEFPKKLSTHDLTKLAGMVDPGLASQYKWPLQYFTDAAVWMGRYPCSKNGEEGTIFIDPRCFDAAEEIYAKYALRFSISG
jgi:hypothetical protein